MSVAVSVTPAGGDLMIWNSLQSVADLIGQGKSLFSIQCEVDIFSRWAQSIDELMIPTLFSPNKIPVSYLNLPLGWRFRFCYSVIMIDECHEPCLATLSMQKKLDFHDTTLALLVQCLNHLIIIKIGSYLLRWIIQTTRMSCRRFGTLYLEP